METAVPMKMETAMVLEEPDMTFTKELRKATKDVHKMNDMLVNAKFAIALSDETVWFDALLAFHDVYEYLEANLPEDLLPKELHRTEAFEKDICHFLGEDWKSTYERRDSVKKYLAHLEEVKEKSELLLFAYAFQMYMALMSGGQLLQKKRMIARNLWVGNRDEQQEKIEDQMLSASGGELENRPMPAQVTICPPGCAATYFPMEISVLKAKLRAILNKHYGQFEEDFKAQFIKETRNVFLFNADIVRSVKGVNRAAIRKVFIVVILIASAYLAIKLAKY